MIAIGGRDDPSRGIWIRRPTTRQTSQTQTYCKSVEICLTPTTDARDSWQAMLRHIACEGRCFGLQSPDTPFKARKVLAKPQLTLGTNSVINTQPTPLTEKVDQLSWKFVVDCVHYNQKYLVIFGQQKLAAEYHTIYPNFADFINSTAVAWLNGYVGDYATMAQLEEEIDNLGLFLPAKEYLRKLVQQFGR